MEDLLKLKELLDMDTFAPVGRQLQQRAWLMHWALFVFFNHENGMNALADLYLSDRQARALLLHPPLCLAVLCFFCFFLPPPGAVHVGAAPLVGSAPRLLGLSPRLRPGCCLLWTAPPTHPPLPASLPSFRQVHHGHPADQPAPAALPGGGGGGQQAAADSAEGPAEGHLPGGRAAA